MNHLKYILEVLLSPWVLALLIALAAGLCRLRGRWRFARGLAVAALLLAYLAAIVPVGDALLGPLERSFPPLSQRGPLPAVNYVVVLGSGYVPRNEVPITAALDEDGLARIIEGVRLARLLGPVRLVVSGGASPEATPSAVGYAALARDLGVSDASLVVLDQPRDTRAEARAIAALLGQQPFLLVTSAYHMRRAIWLLRRAGAQPIAAPTGQIADKGRIGWSDFLPSSGGLRRTERALHEYFGMFALTVGLG
jgi:uncharacterized SAM-binding protein YcdF (DUF218 family)